MTEFVSDIDHYNAVLARVAGVRSSLWIGTADIKDLHVKVGPTSQPFLAVIFPMTLQSWMPPLKSLIKYGEAASAASASVNSIVRIR